MAEGTEKLPRETVNYRLSRNDVRCGTCASFDVPTKSCTLVAGTIAANMKCDRWTKMPGLTQRDVHPGPRHRAADPSA